MKIAPMVPATPTPVLLFSESRFKDKFSEFARLGEVFYPVKANDHPAILRTVRIPGHRGHRFRLMAVTVPG